MLKKNLEIELKFSLENFQDHKYLKDRIIDSLKEYYKNINIIKYEKKNLETIYFDNKKLELHKKKIALRFRHFNNNLEQTFKTANFSKNGLSSRYEINTNLDKEEFNFSNIKEPYKKYLLKIEKELQKVFTTKFIRESIFIKTNNLKFEICLDKGYIFTDYKKDLINELEIEFLEYENKKDILDLRDFLKSKLDLNLLNISKAEKGYKLFCIK